MKEHKRPRSAVYQSMSIVTPYWRPGEDYMSQILEAVKHKIRNGDFVAISEKAISTASGNMMDESTLKACWLARLLAGPWMHYAWGYALGVICHLRRKTINRFRTYPVSEGSKHKQLALIQNGFFHALMHGSEGGIDGSNVPYSYVSLPLKEAQRLATSIRKCIGSKLGVDVSVLIIDTDKTYSVRSFHFTQRPNAIRGIQPNLGIFGYVAGRFLKLSQRATPVATSDPISSVEMALQVADVADRARGFGAGRNVWDMAEAFDVPLTEVTWEMLDRVEHKPIVIVRRA